MSYVIVKVTNWRDQRDSGYRVAPIDGGFRRFLLNPDRISDLLSDPADANKSIFKFFDNKLDRREKWSVIHADISVSELVAASNTAFESSMITLPIHKNNDPDKATVDTTMPVGAIAYADDYNPRVSNHCWVIYYNAAFKRREVLCNMNIKQLEGFAETGNTSTSYPGFDQGNPSTPVGSDR